MIYYKLYLINNYLSHKFYYIITCGFMKNVYTSLNDGKTNISKFIYYIFFGMFIYMFIIYLLVYISFWGLSILGILL